MSLVLVGTNYRHSNMAFREQLVSREDHVERYYHRLREAYHDYEAVIVSTCNRFEIYVWRASHARPDVDDLHRVLADVSGLAVDQIRAKCYVHRQEQAVRHLYKVASAMDSMLAGEPQITGQVRSALNLALKHQTAGTYLTKLFQDSLRLARRIRQRSGIAEGHFSLGSVAAQFADQLFGTAMPQTFLVIGAGKMGASTLQHLIADSDREVFIASRDMNHAQTLTKSVPCARAIDWQTIDAALVKADVVISCTSAIEPVLIFDRVRQLSDLRSGQPMLMIDLGLPRNIDPQVGQLSWVRLYDLESLEKVLRQQNDQRRSQLEQFEHLIDRAVDVYQQWQQRRTVIPAIVALRRKIHDIGEQELDLLEEKLKDVDPKELAMIRKMVHRIIHKVLHDPTAAISEQAHQMRGSVYAGILQKLFKLPAGKPPSHPIISTEYAEPVDES